MRLSRTGAIDAFSLSDISSYLDDAAHAQLFQSVLTAARPAAKIVSRSNIHHRPLTPEQALHSTELLRHFEAALGELPPLQQQVLVLFDVERFSGEEVCNILGISDTNQRVLLHRARARVRTSLEQRLASAENGA